MPEPVKPRSTPGRVKSADRLWTTKERRRSSSFRSSAAELRGSPGSSSRAGSHAFRSPVIARLRQSAVHAVFEASRHVATDACVGRASESARRRSPAGCVSASSVGSWLNPPRTRVMEIVRDLRAFTPSCRAQGCSLSDLVGCSTQYRWAITERWRKLQRAREPVEEVAAPAHHLDTRVAIARSGASSSPGADRAGHP